MVDQCAVKKRYRVVFTLADGKKRSVQLDADDEWLSSPEYPLRLYDDKYPTGPAVVKIVITEL